MTKVIAVLNLDFALLEFHQKHGNDISLICNKALAKHNNARKTINEASNKVHEFEFSKNGSGFIPVQEKRTLKQDTSMLIWGLNRCSVNTGITREKFNITLQNVAYRHKMSVNDVANEAFSGGLKHINSVFKARSIPKPENNQEQGNPSEASGRETQ